MKRDVFPLPPKMTKQYAEMARRGEYDNKYGDGDGAIFTFLTAHEEVTLIGCDDAAVGHFIRRKQP